MDTEIKARKGDPDPDRDLAIDFCCVVEPTVSKILQHYRLWRVSTNTLKDLLYSILFVSYNIEKDLCEELDSLVMTGFGDNFTLYELTPERMRNSFFWKNRDINYYVEMFDLLKLTTGARIKLKYSIEKLFLD